MPKSKNAKSTRAKPVKKPTEVPLEEPLEERLEEVVERPATRQVPNLMAVPRSVVADGMEPKPINLFGGEIMNPLKEILRNDQSRIFGGELTRVPATHSIEQIIKEYTTTLSKMDIPEPPPTSEVQIASKRSPSKPMMELSARGLISYFNFGGNRLFYSQEREQFENLKTAKGLKAEKWLPHGFELVKEYGIVHLLRMLSMMPSFCKQYNWKDSNNIVMENVRHFLVYLSENHRSFFDPSNYYENQKENKK